MGHMGMGNLGTGHLGTGNLSGAPLAGGGFGMEHAGMTAQSEAFNGGDALEVYFECITTCSLDDGACVTRCVEQLREQP